MSRVDFTQLPSTLSPLSLHFCSIASFSLCIFNMPDCSWRCPFCILVEAISPFSICYTFYSIFYTPISFSFFLCPFPFPFCICCSVLRILHSNCRRLSVSICYPSLLPCCFLYYSSLSSYFYL